LCADARRVLTTQLDQPRLSNPLRNRAVDGVGGPRGNQSRLEAIASYSES
jgi:hypothetical protein